MERVDPRLSLTEARHAAERFVATAQRTSQRPDWLRGRERPGGWYLVAPHEFPGVVGIGAGNCWKTVVAHRQPGECTTVGASLRFVGFDPSAFAQGATAA
jgi:hypothetical protein